MFVSVHLHCELDDVLMGKHIQVLDFLIHFLHHHMQVFQKNHSVLMLSFMLLLLLKDSDSLCFW